MPDPTPGIGRTLAAAAESMIKRLIGVVSGLLPPSPLGTGSG
ncbi:hypothetical protein [Nocardia sp. CNY236]|nr:hypothetical protein [Nocardia sp. CNY236]